MTHQADEVVAGDVKSGTVGEPVGFRGRDGCYQKSEFEFLTGNILF